MCINWHHIKASKMKYFGHILRQPKDSTQHAAMTGLTEGSKIRGRPRTSWIDNIFQWSRLCRSRLLKTARDRQHWHEVVHHYRQPSHMTWCAWYLNWGWVYLSLSILVPLSTVCFLTDTAHLTMSDNEASRSNAMVYYHVQRVVKRRTASRGIESHFIFHCDSQSWAAATVLGGMLYLTDIDNWPKPHCITTAARHEPTLPTHQNVCNTTCTQLP